LRVFATLLLLSLALVSGAAQAQSAQARKTPSGAQKSERIEAELVPMSAWAAPGSTAVVAVRQQIRPGWHTYWRNPGDSGGPTTLSWTLPSGVAAGEIVWPLPQRQRLQGLTNFGYEGEVFLPVPIEVPASARPGSSLPLSVRAVFLVCSAEMCVPDQMTLTLALPIKEGAAPLAGAIGRRIQTVVETAPRPAGITAHVILDGRTLSLSATGGPLGGLLNGLTPKQASFFPYEGEIIDHAAAQFGQRGPEGLTLALATAPDLKTLSGPVSGVLSTDLGSWEITAIPGPVLPGASGAGSLEPTPDAFGQAGAPPKTGWADVLKAAGFALLGGLILNLMPCVFPVLAMKAASLTRSAHAPAEARRDGIAFTLGVLVSFAVLAAILLVLRAGGQAVGWGFQLQSPAVVAALAVLMLAVALNLSGVFEVGGRLQAAGGSRLTRLPGGTGAFFTGVLAVVVAAPCTAPFMAFALGAALVMPAPLAMVVFLMLGLGLALPYLLVSLSPGLLAKLPKPGRWMVLLQRWLALPMYAAAAWLVWVFWRQTSFPVGMMVINACVLMTIGLFMVGVFSRRARWGIGYGWALVVFAVAMTGFAGHTGDRAAARAAARAEIPADAWSEAKVETALAQGRPVLVNFTADWCVSCKINERTALSSSVTARALKGANALYLEGDWTRRDDAITRELQRHGRSGVPLYLVYTPGKAEPEILPQLLTDGVVVEALK
jgi:DsbC/DsbD-like thiol-disulfide interchange protein/cytochrome c biogenesis protein CcdA